MNATLTVLFLWLLLLVLKKKASLWLAPLNNSSPELFMTSRVGLLKDPQTLEQGTISVWAWLCLSYDFGQGIVLCFGLIS